MDFSLDLECKYSDFTSPRLQKLSSDKRYRGKSTKKNASITKRNFEQKITQHNNIILRKAHENEKEQKLNPELRKRNYYCYTCDKIKKIPCKCGYINWCGGSESFDNCECYKITGIYCNIPYNDLCEYHIKNYEKYWSENN
jgi:hypothetical protein